MADRSVSLTMPYRLASWNTGYGIAPIFEMNLPEGTLRERLRLRFAKALGSFDDYDLLGIVGRSQVGRVRYTGSGEELLEDVPFQSVQEILARNRGGDLLAYLLEKFAAHSGVSGVQPKILLRDEAAHTGFGMSPRRLSPRASLSHRGATHIVKFWEPREFPELAANEYFCLRVAAVCGLPTPTFRLSEDGMALALDRFDLREDGSYRGFEDFCVLNGRRTDQKYLGSYETAIMRRFERVATGDSVAEDQERLFQLVAINCAIRNGDAHLKNFGVVYDDWDGPVRLAPVYDLVTTTVYVPQDGMALTLNGTTNWPRLADLMRMGETRLSARPGRVKALLEVIPDAIETVAKEVVAYGDAHRGFREVGARMLEQWRVGVRESLQ
jgi:serine/threonine-protein kinase HipA